MSSLRHARWLVVVLGLMLVPVMAGAKYETPVDPEGATGDDDAWADGEPCVAIDDPDGGGDGGPSGLNGPGSDVGSSGQCCIEFESLLLLASDILFEVVLPLGH
jgi:hypothetical protein